MPDRKGQGLVPEEYLAGKPGSILPVSCVERRHAELVAATQAGQGAGREGAQPPARVTFRRQPAKGRYRQWLLSNPRFSSWMTPRGIDVGAKYEIYKLMNDLAERRVDHRDFERTGRSAGDERPGDGHA